MNLPLSAPGSSKTALAPAELGQERRLVTVLFADIVSFTALAETLDPEELQELMSGIFESLVGEAVKNDGTIEKLIGDAIFVIFGAPVAHEDDAERALRTALAMQQAFAEHAAVVRSRYGRELSLRVGVHTGIVVAGAVRTPTQYGVMGDTVNVASRLQETAQPGEILVTQATFRLTSARFSFREVGPVQVKGKEQPVLAYALTGEREVARPSVELNTPLVGRWMELSRLDLAYQSALVGRAEFVAISGEPGIGKSRLMNEFVALLEGSREDPAASVRVLRWTYSGVGVRSYAGFVETLEEGLGIDREAPEALTRLEARVHELAPPQHEVAQRELAAFLGLRAGAPEASDVEEVRRRRYGAVRDTFAALARERPLVLVLEDLHHADSASLDLLAFLLAHPLRARLLMLLTFRGMPDALARVAPRANFTSLILDPLTPDESARILESVLEWVPDDLRDRVVERTGGNPFFIELTLRALIDSGAIARNEDGWRLVRAPEQLEVPATLHALVAARIDRLPPLARECIQYAAVIGPRFGYRVLVAAAGEQVANGVDQLIDADLVFVPEADDRLRRLGRFRFKHAITQEVAYQTLLVRRRVEMHRRVAEAIETVYAKDLTDLYPALAHHYALGEVAGRAADYAAKAAAVALENHAHGEALRHAEQAASLFEREGRAVEAVQALRLVGTVQRYRGEFDAAVGAYQRALPIAEELEAGGTLTRELYAAIAETATRWHAKLPDLDAFIDRGLALVGTGPTRERALLLASRAFGVRRKEERTREDWVAALGTAREALAIAESLGELREVSLCLDAVGYAERELGRFADALRTNERRIPIARTLQDSDELIDAYTMVAEATAIVGTLSQAAEHAKRARQLAAATAKPSLGAAAAGCETQVRLLASDFAGALSIAREIAAEPEPRRYALEAIALGSVAAAALGDPSEQELREIVVKHDYPAQSLAGVETLAAFYAMRTTEASYHAALEGGWPRFNVGRTLLLPTAVLAAARWGIAKADTIAAARERAIAHGHQRGVALAMHADAVQRRDAGEVERALHEYERLGLLFEQALALYDLALLRAREAAPEDVEPLVRRARSLAERIGAEPLLVALRT